MPESEALKPDVCPFCSSKEIRVNRATHTMGGYCQCLICGAEGPVKDTTPEAVAAWNKRTDPVIELAQKVAHEWPWRGVEMSEAELSHTLRCVGNGPNPIPLAVAIHALAAALPSREGENV